MLTSTSLAILSGLAVFVLWDVMWSFVVPALSRLNVSPEYSTTGE